MLYQWYCVEDRNKIIWDEYSTGHQTHVTSATDVIIWTWTLVKMPLMLCSFRDFCCFSWYSKVFHKYFQGTFKVFPRYFKVFPRCFNGFSWFFIFWNLLSTHVFTMFFRFMDHCMELIVMVTNHLSSDAMFVMYFSCLCRTPLEWADGLLSKKWSGWWVTGVEWVIPFRLSTKAPVVLKHPVQFWDSLRYI